MDKFIWTQDHSVGIKEIDEQHQEFFGLANLIIDMMAGSPTREELLSAMEKLGDYALYHFSTEEKYFDKFSYGEAPQHIAEHNAYREKITNFLNRVNSEGSDMRDLTLEVAAYSNAWLSTHILLIDKKYTKFFNEHGLR